MFDKQERTFVEAIVSTESADDCGTSQEVSSSNEWALADIREASSVSRDAIC